jgi:hypothetical protein
MYCCLSIENFLGIVGSKLILCKSLEAVIYSGEVSEGSIVLLVLQEGSAEIGNTF